MLAIHTTPVGAAPAVAVMAPAPHGMAHESGDNKEDEGGDNGGDYDDDERMNAGVHIPGCWPYVQPQR